MPMQSQIINPDLGDSPDPSDPNLRSGPPPPPPQQKKMGGRGGPDRRLFWPTHPLHQHTGTWMFCVTLSRYTDYSHLELKTVHLSNSSNRSAPETAVIYSRLPHEVFHFIFFPNTWKYRWQTTVAKDWVLVRIQDGGAEWNAENRDEVKLECDQKERQIRC